VSDFEKEGKRRLKSSRDRDTNRVVPKRGREEIERDQREAEN
jgi:hypothetical protein